MSTGRKRSGKQQREEEKIYICVVFNFLDDGGLVEVEVVGIVGVTTTKQRSSQEKSSSPSSPSPLVLALLFKTLNTLETTSQQTYAEFMAERTEGPRFC